MKVNQQGWTLWSLLAVFLLIAFFAVLSMKLFPVYMDNYKLVEALESVSNDPRAPDWNRNQFIRELDNILYIDYGHEIVDLKDALTLERTNTGKIATIEYEVVVHLAYNLSALMDFKNQVEIFR